MCNKINRPNNKVRIGCRLSQLSYIQALLVQKKLADAQVDSELVFFKTIGDAKQRQAINKIKAIGVFTKEIDNALKSGLIDISVHSLKDIGTLRPKGIVTAAILDQREPPNDVCLFRNNVIEKLQLSQEIIIGTSSPRRQLLCKQILPKLLPKFNNNEPKVLFKVIRGNITTRINKAGFDGIVLAMAGLRRLLKHGYELKNRKIMVLPISECPGAPGQGAIAVEALKSNKHALNICMKILNDESVAECVNYERSILKYHDGGCHAQFGVTRVQLSDKYNIVYCKGKNADSQDISKTEVQFYYDIYGKGKAAHIRGSMLYEISEIRDYILPRGQYCIFVAKFISKKLCNQILQVKKKVMASSLDVWQKLAANGIWVEGCAEGFGIEYMMNTMMAGGNLFKMHNHWLNITHSNAYEYRYDSREIKVSNFPVYTLNHKEEVDNVIRDVASSKYIYWSSYYIFQSLFQYSQKNAIHSCGFGKTYKLIKNHGITVIPFHNVASWREWVRA